MAETTAIEWCDATFNPWIGCTKVSPACDYCYAARQDAHRKWTPEGWGGPRRRTGAELWKGPVKWNAQPFVECMGCRWRGEARECVLRDNLPGFDRDPGAMRCCPKCHEPLLKEARRRVFCASLADWLDNEVPIEWLVDLLDTIRRTPELDWLLLSKRIGNWRKRLEEAVAFIEAERRNDNQSLQTRVLVRAWLGGAPPANVWIMATICNQPEADRDIAKLLAVPARVRGLSIEPMLGPVRLDPTWIVDYEIGPPDRRLHWVICGGESGPKARPPRLRWIRSLRDQCAAARVPFLLKQIGEYSVHEVGPGGEIEPPSSMSMRGLKQWRDDLQRFADVPKDAKVAEVFNPGAEFSLPVGKAAAGRLLDGVEHNGFPA